MRSALRSTGLVLAVLGAAYFVAGCGGGGDSPPAPSAPSAPVFGTVRGTVYAPDGQTPVEGALVYVPGTKGGNRAVATPEPSIAAALSLPNGSFELTGVPEGSATVKILKGAWSKTVQVTVAGNQVAELPAASTTLPAQTGSGGAAPKIAVVTGSWDRIQDVLAKLGMGVVDAAGNLQAGTETFDLYDGEGNSLHPAAATLFADAAKMATYDIIFINCGADTSPLSDTQSKANIKAYVNNGGRLYVTDLSYGFVEQVFPEYIDFHGSDGTPATDPEVEGAAEVGDSGIATDADLLDTDLKAWLGNFSGVLNPSGTIHIEGFLSGWAVVDAASDSAKIWVQGSVSYSTSVFSAGTKPGDAHSSFKPATRSRDQSVKPLTVTFRHGNGRVLYTSYHTEDQPSVTLRPQERILAYLVFELAEN